jgi:hypothetical protein
VVGNSISTISSEGIHLLKTTGSKERGAKLAGNGEEGGGPSTMYRVAEYGPCRRRNMLFRQVV